jgi:hypothetical protein
MAQPVDLQQIYYIKKKNFYPLIPRFSMVNKRLILDSPQPIRVLAQRIKVYGVVFSKSK